MTNPLWQAGREIACDPDLTTDLTAWIEKTCAIRHVDGLTVARLQLVCEELFANLAGHGAAAPDEKLQITLTGMADAVRIDWQDPGVAFNPLDAGADHWQEDDVADRPVGGLGLHLVRNLVRNLTYRHENGRNCLTMELPV